MKKLDKYPKLDDYVTKLQLLTNALSEDRTKVSTALVNELASEVKKISVDDVLTQASGAFSLTNAKTEFERCANIHQAERALRLCMLLEESELIPKTKPDRWKPIGVRATDR